MPPTIEVPGPDGKPTKAEPVAVVSSSVRPTEILLEDGTTLRLSHVVQNVAKVKGQFDEHGNPMYVVISSNVLATPEVPEHLKQK